MDSLRKSFAFLMYHRILNTGSIISMHSHPYVMRCPVHKCNASVIACHFMLNVRYASHATYKSNITCQVSFNAYNFFHFYPTCIVMALTRHTVSSEGVIFFLVYYKLINIKFVHSYNVKHLTCTIFYSNRLQNIYKLHI